MREEDNEPRRHPATYRVGEALDDCSLDELDARIAVLQTEIARIEAVRRHKQSALAAAGSAFKLQGTKL